MLVGAGFVASTGQDRTGQDMESTRALLSTLLLSLSRMRQSWWVCLCVLLAALPTGQMMGTMVVCVLWGRRD